MAPSPFTFKVASTTASGSGRGAAGTSVIRQPVTQARLREELPMRLPSSGPWLLKILGRDNRFVFGLYRRHMKAIGHLGTLDRLFGVPATTRNWNTMTAIAGVLGMGGA